MRFRLAGVVNDSIVDGPGLRLAVFAQGCPHHCPECHNPQSHDFDGGEWGDTAEILRIAEDNCLLDGITLTGGEPFCQPEACAELARGAHELGLNVWVYTGYLFENLLNGTDAQRELLKNADVLVDGPFLIAQKSMDVRFRGSKNQRLIDVQKSLNAGHAVELEA
ncbi:MAG: anaerobic ribonucleoside-triphosphate reductase activating protein [Clostridia bacterium]|nr:anaerobic ribonucleoside-triphosphate reductase activating protein [Clostridia bacterium]